MKSPSTAARRTAHGNAGGAGVVAVLVTAGVARGHPAVSAPLLQNSAVCPWRAAGALVEREVAHPLDGRGAGDRADTVGSTYVADPVQV